MMLRHATFFFPTAASIYRKDVYEKISVTLDSFLCVAITIIGHTPYHIVQELCESRGGRPGLSVLTSLLVSVDVKNY